MLPDALLNAYHIAQNHTEITTAIGMIGFLMCCMYYGHSKLSKQYD